MRRKGLKLNENPEKMPVTTTGIEMKRSTRPTPIPPERLTGGNGVADERGVARLVTDYIERDGLPEA